MLRHADDITLNHLIELRKLEQENERLREALQKIAESQPSDCEQAFNFKMIARAALKETE